MFPTHQRYLCRLDFGLEEGAATELPPREGNPYPNLVSAVDEDGNERGGIMLPDITVPLATHMGWNPRRPDTGAPDQNLENDRFHHSLCGHPFGEGGHR